MNVIGWFLVFAVFVAGWWWFVERPARKRERQQFGGGGGAGSDSGDRDPKGRGDAEM